MREDAPDRPLRFVEDRAGPTHTVERCVGQRQKQVPVQRTHQRTGINERGEPIGEHGSEAFCVQRGKFGQRLVPCHCSLLTVSEQILGPDPPVPANHRVLDLLPIQKLDEEGA